MLAIRLARTGRNKYPTYRIVAAESARATTGKFVAILGHYNPHTKELIIKKEETVKYISNGAQPSNTVIKLLQREKMELPKWVVLATKNKASKQTPVEAPAAKVPASNESEVEATVGETAETEAPVVEAVADGSNEVEQSTVGAEAAEENAEAIADTVTESAPEDTAAGEEAQAGSTEQIEGRRQRRN